MHIKFIGRGKGSAKDAETYNLQTHDHNGEVRADVQVLRGNPSFVSELADSLEFEHRYTSGVIAWHVDDNPTEEQIAQVLNDFEKVAFAGLDASQYAYYAVLHEENNGAKHVHVVSARVELSTGKSMNIAPPDWQKTYDVLVDKYNTKYNWASPKDLHRRKLVNNKISIHSDLTHSKAKVEINKAVMELVGQGTIQNEKDVLKYLNSIDGVTVKPRRSKKTLSIELEGIKKPIKLEGLAYGKGFDVRELRQELRAEQEQRAKATTADRAREHDRVHAVFENIVSDRAKYNRSRYDQKAQQVTREDERSPSEHHQGRERSPKDLTHQPKGDRERSPLPDAEREQGQDALLDSTPDSGTLNHTRASDRNVGARSGNLWTHPDPYDIERRDRPSPNSQRGTREVSSDSEDVQQRDRAKERAKRMAEQGRELDSSVREDGGVDHDAIRERITAKLEATRGVVLQRAKDRNKDLREAFSTDNGLIQRADERSVESDRTAEQDVGEVRKHINQLADKHRRGTATAVADQSQQLDKATGRIGGARQGLVGAVKKCVEKAIEKVKEIAKKITHTQSRGWGMSR